MDKYGEEREWKWAELQIKKTYFFMTNTHQDFLLIPKLFSPSERRRIVECAEQLGFDLRPCEDEIIIVGLDVCDRDAVRAFFELCQVEVIV